MKKLILTLLMLPTLCQAQWEIPTKSLDSTSIKTIINAAPKGVLVLKNVNNHIVLELTDVEISSKIQNIHYQFLFLAGSTEGKTIGFVTPEKDKIILEKDFEKKIYSHYFRTCEELIITINNKDRYVFNMSNIYTAYFFVVK